MDLYQLVQMWQQFGVYDILLPFLLIFTIAFATLEKISLFGKEKKNVNIIIALVIAFYFLNNAYLIFILQKLLPNVSIILVVFIAFFLLFGIFGGKNSAQGSALTIAFFVSLIAIILALGSDMFYPGPVSPYGGGVLAHLAYLWNSMSYNYPGATAAILGILGIVVIVAMVGGIGSGNRGKGWKAVQNFVNDFQGGNN